MGIESIRKVILIVMMYSLGLGNSMEYMKRQIIPSSINSFKTFHKEILKGEDPASKLFQQYP